MLSLAVSTSTQVGSLCVFRDKEILFQTSWNKNQAHSEVLIPMIENAYHFCNIEADQIGLYICDIGPGSFTGVRVATSTLKAFAYANTVPCIQIDSLRALAEGASIYKKPILCLVNAQRNEFYTAIYEHGVRGLKTKMKPKLMSIEKINKLLTKKYLAVGNGVSTYMMYASKSALSKIETTVNDVENYPLAMNFINYAYKELKLNKTIEWKFLEPLYIRPSAAEEKLLRGELQIAKSISRKQYTKT